MKGYEDIRDAFPYKDSKGDPMFRAGQFETIAFIKDAMVDGYKYIGVDAKTGSGKSVINYTVLNSIKGKSVYLTPQKQLQDQVGAEGWDNVAVLKGYSGYACTYCQPVKEIKYRTNYDGDEVEMCNNMPTPKFEGVDWDGLENSIAHHIDILDNSPTKQYKTSFESVKDFNEKRISLTNMADRLKGLDDDDPKKPGLLKNPDVTADEYVYRSIACPFAAIECPKKSARELSSLAKISVLSPDIMFYMNKFGGKFEDIDTLVIDEAHGFEDVIQRIFSSSLPITLLRDIYGINLFPLIDGVKEVESVEIFTGSYREYLFRIANTLKVVAAFRHIYGICNTESSVSTTSSSAMYVKEFKRKYSSDIKHGDVSPLSIVLDSIKGNHSFISDLINEKMDSIDNEYGFEDISVIVDSIKRSISSSIINMKASKASRFNISMSSVSTDSVVFDMLEELRSLIVPFIEKTDSLCSIAGETALPFLFSVSDGGAKDIPYSFKRDKIVSPKATHEVLSTVVIDTGAIARIFFYSKAKHVVFTTGTWIYRKSMMKALGINSDNTAFHEMPSTFRKERRPVYLVRDKALTDFSAKSPSGGYAYETASGRQRYVNSVVKMVNSIQEGLKESHGENVNVIIHTNSFKISQAIAELGNFKKGKYIFHGQAGTTFYDNKNHGLVYTYTKEQFMIHCNENKDSGLVFVSPSITEGVDFKHKLARAQIILKHPLPYWGNPYIRAAMGSYDIEGLDPDRDIYNRMTYTTIVQQYGRVMRDEADWGLTFIVDQKSVGDLGKLLSNNKERKKAGIEYFIEGIKMNKRPNGSYQLLRPNKIVLDY